jgi:hypothetical protein
MGLPRLRHGRIGSRQRKGKENELCDPTHTGIIAISVPLICQGNSYRQVEFRQCSQLAQQFDRDPELGVPRSVVSVSGAEQLAQAAVYDRRFD